VDCGVSRAQIPTQHDQLPTQQIERVIDRVPARRALAAMLPHQPILFNLSHEIAAAFLFQLRQNPVIVKHASLLDGTTSNI
jgi:hypothetical protein